MGFKCFIECMCWLCGWFYDGMCVLYGVFDEVIDWIYEKLEVFVNFGFFESYVLSFVLLVFYLVWFKLYYLVVFCVVLLCV